MDFESRTFSVFFCIAKYIFSKNLRLGLGKVARIFSTCTITLFGGLILIGVFGRENIFIYDITQKLWFSDFSSLFWKFRYRDRSRALIGAGDTTLNPQTRFM